MILSPSSVLVMTFSATLPPFLLALNVVPDSLELRALLSLITFRGKALYAVELGHKTTSIQWLGLGSP